MKAASALLPILLFSSAQLLAQAAGLTANKTTPPASTIVVEQPVQPEVPESSEATKTQQENEGEPSQQIIEKKQAIAQISVGSHLPRANNLHATVVQSVTRDEIIASGNNTLSGYMSTLPYNVGGEFQTDSFQQNFSQTTASLNFRGLGLGSTLVLIDGVRQTYSAAATADSSTFFDVNAVPFIYVEKANILKESASSVYGSDAVAGVVNFSTRKSFRGFEISGNYQEVEDGGAGDSEIGFIWGEAIGEESSFVLAASYFDRERIEADEREFTEGTGTSILGSPGAFVVPSVNPAAPIIPSYCAAGGGTPLVLGSGGGNDFGFCQFDYMPFYDVQNSESRYNVAGNFDTFLLEDHKLSVNISTAQQKMDEGRFSSSFPVLELQAITAANPHNTYGETVVYAGRTFGSTAPVQYGHRESNTHRAVISLEGEMFGYWGYDTALQYSENDYKIRNDDTVTASFGQALNAGFGGQFWNPFVADTYEANKDLIPYVFDELQIDRKAALLTWDFSANTVLGNVAGRPLMFAAGLQYRKEGLEQTVDDVYENYGYGFTLGGSEFDEDRDVVAVFSELEIPVAKIVTANLALRYEDYGSDGGDELSPRVSLALHPTDNFNIMATASTAFRQPSLAQVAGDTMVILSEVSDDGAAPGFIAVKPNANPDLTSEKSTAFSLNVFYRPIDQLSFNLDFWRYEIEDVIVAENAQAIIDAENAGDLAAMAKVTRSIANTIQSVDVTFINAGKVTTDGVDFTVAYTESLGAAGTLIFKTGATYINSYDLTGENGDTTDVAGSRNFNTFARPLPELRANVSFAWRLAAHEATLYGYYIDSYQNDQLSVNGVANNGTIDSTDVWNLQYAYNGRVKDDQWQLRLGVNNLFDEEPPYVPTNLGYDTKMHDARGRMFYLGGEYKF